MSDLSICISCLIPALLLLLAANGAPILTAKWLGKHMAWPIDFGYCLANGTELLGHSKTWRGLISAMFCTGILAVFFRIDPLIGTLFGILSMAGDCISSFIKRRLKYRSSSRSRGLDTVPESLLPILVLKQPLSLGAIDIFTIVLIFFLLEEFVSPILFYWHIRNRPY